MGGNGLTLDEVAQLTDAEKQEHSNNAKLVQAAEQALIFTVYSIKACMLLIYTRLT